ncbi:hypothetical protein DCAR_0625290 [Daucus carota subsp. sativus]|uniref:DUF7705 domain-containing protein n=1 Tax=Daucus carota subsp. sativus TaxID=79200 RepID=A0AAF0XF18_DAUCS|nr:PREDICTED: uncharacterized protein LOC108225212 [Daucus carota subsp. sativus]WOH05867.1 hypothetical protein DCAR_0625290 [Daucus carota subsp. sativus]
MEVHYEKYLASLCVMIMLMCSVSWVRGGDVTAIGDPGMKRDGLRVAIEAWNQCNEVGEEAPDMGSPRQADCFDLLPHHSTPTSSLPFELIHRVNQTDNMYGIMNAQKQGLKDIDLDKYAAWKEVYLGTKCQVSDKPTPWQFWMIMLKSGNMDTLAAVCPENGKKAQPFPQESRFPCFGQGCMNMPRIYHDYTSVQGNSSMKGRFYGTWDLSANITTAKTANETSYYSVTWEKEIGRKGSWVFHHFLKTSTNYPWLMLYLRSDATNGFSGGYHYQTRGMTKIVPKSPHFKVRFTLDIKQGGGPKSQFYLMDIGSCWKNNGQPCDGDVTTDVTRYSEMIINPGTEAWCKPDDLGKCPPYHTLLNGTKIHRSDTRDFPYDAYHIYCSPGNAEHIESPFNYCDAYSNPQPQEILQILPHPVWGEYGYPIRKGQGWVNDSRTWELDVGRLSQSLYFYQDPGAAPFERHWPSIDLGTEIYISDNQVAEWTVSDFDIIVPDTQSAEA